MSKTPRIMPKSRMQTDTLQNLLSGMGGAGDKTIYTAWMAATIMSPDQLESAYRSDWVARKGIDIPANDATREWRSWQADRDDITELEEHEKQFEIKKKTARVMKKARLYGGGALILGVNQGSPEDELIVDRVRKGDLKFVHAVSRYEITAGPLETNLLSPNYGQPTYYERQGVGLAVRLHPSRVLRFIGLEYPNEAQQSDGWGDPVLQIVQQAIKAAGTVTQGAAHLVDEAKVDVIKIPELTASIEDSVYESKLKRRFGLASDAKSIYKMLLLDTQEEWERIQYNFSQLPELVRMYMLITAGALDIPATRFLGQAPLGLNATGESDTRNYYDRIASEQETDIAPVLERLDEVLIRSALGTKPDELHYVWNPLWQMDEKEKAEIDNKKANTFKIDVDAGVLDGAVLKEARQNQLIEDGTYPGIEQTIEEFGEEFEEPQPMLMQPGALPPANENDPAEEITVQAARVRATDAKRYRVRRDRVMRVGRRVARAMPKKRLTNDAKPRTLYVRRDVLNWAAIAAHFKQQGIKTTVGKSMHVTIAYSRTPIDWTKVGEAWGQDEKGRVFVKPGGMRMVERLGGDATVLLFTNNELSWRWCQIKECGASWDWPDYQPHITITYDGPQDLSTIMPYQGEIVLGPEIFEEVSDGYKDLIVEDAKALRSYVVRNDELKGVDLVKAIADGVARIQPPPVNVTVPAPVKDAKRKPQRMRVVKRDEKGRASEFETAED